MRYDHTLLNGNWLAAHARSHGLDGLAFADQFAMADGGGEGAVKELAAGQRLE
jgi:hypothetical protein